MNPYETDLKYLTDDLLVNGFDFSPLHDAISKELDDESSTISEMHVKLSAIPPAIDDSLIEEFSTTGKIKTYQKKEMVIKLRDAIKGALGVSLEHSLNRFLVFKHNVKISISHAQSETIVEIQISKITNYTTQMVNAIISHFEVPELGYCASVEAKLIVNSGKDTTNHVIFSELLSKKRGSKIHDYLTLKDRKVVASFFSLPKVKEILFSYIFPRGLNTEEHAEITFDTLQEFTAPLKRRKIQDSKGAYHNLHEVLTPYTPDKEFARLMTEHHISALYPSTRTSRDNVCYLLVDIDFSSFLKRSFPAQLIWEFTLTITEYLTEQFTSLLHFPPPLVNFSGSKGVHLVYKVSENAIPVVNKYLNFWELYLLPKQKALAKEGSKSLFRNPFTFTKTMMQSILLYCIENFPSHLIPEEIQVGLGITRLMDLFTLSVFSHNRIGILMDTSSNNASVFRVFSFHPSTKRISIPITDANSKKIKEEYRNYDVVLQACDASHIIEQFKQNKGDHYAQKPPSLTNQHFKYLLRPDTMLPLLATIVRFGDRWICDRSAKSFRFWFDYYELNTFYEYIKALILLISEEKGNKGSIYVLISELIEKCNIHVKKYTKQVIDEYFFEGSSYKSLKDKLDAYKNIEFYYRFQWNDLKPLNAMKIQEILRNEKTGKQFLYKFQSLHSIVQVILGQYATDKSSANPHIAKVIYTLYARLYSLVKTTKKSQLKFSKSHERILQLFLLYNVYTRFLIELFKIRVW